MITHHRLWRIVAFVLSALLLAGALGIGGHWVRQYEEENVVDILASREPELGLPVFAQFVVTQRVTVPAIASVTRLSIPLYVPDSGHTLSVSIRQQDRTIQEWLFVPTQEGVIEAELSFIQPTLIEGQVDIVFDGRHISHEQAETAPRLFVEPLDSAYEGGNYRIAANEKKGDIALALIARQQRWERYAQTWHSSPATLVTDVGRAGLVLMLLVVLPHALMRGWARTNRHTTA